MTQELPHGFRGRLEELFNGLRQGILSLRRLHVNKLVAKEIIAGTIKARVSNIVLGDAISVDTINEYTSGVGVTVDSVLLKDGLVDGIDVAARDHAQAHTVASHSDTTATGAETETLTDGSDADALHDHATLITAAEAIAAVEGEATLGLAGDVTIAAGKSLSTDTILETTPGLGITIEGALLQHFTQLQEIATPANPDLNYLRLFARASGDNIVLIARSSQGAEAILATLDDTAGAHTNTLALNWIE